MPARLRPRPEVPGSIVTVTSEPLWADKKGIAHHFGVSTRQVDYWRAAGWFPFLKVKGVLRFDIAACSMAFTRRFKDRQISKKRGAVLRQPPRNSTRVQSDAISVL